jgi:hypothetical protein
MMAKRRRQEFVAFLARLEGITLRHFRPEFRGMTRILKREDVEPVKPAPVAPATPAQGEPVPA